jgi:mannan endo-1,4-beta-mannosidase
MRRRSRHRGAMTLAICIPAVLLIVAAYGLSGGFKSTPGPHPGGASGQAGPKAPPVRPGLNIGVYEPAPTPALKTVQAFGTAIGQQPDLLLTYSEWNTAFQKGIAWSAYGKHITVIDQMEPKNISIRAIAEGKDDGYLRKYANSVAKFGHPIIIGFGHEMNGSWYSWGRKHVPASTWVAAWRHVVTVFRQQHAVNAHWLWTVAHADTGLRQYWPGAKYVSWVGIDGYFERPGDGFASIFGVTLKAIRKFTTYPVLIAETAAGPLTGHQAKDVRRLFAGVEKDHLTGLVWFNKKQDNGLHHQDWLLTGSALAAFREAAKSSR